MTKLTIPSVGTQIPFDTGLAALSRDNRTHICRISFDEHKQAWVLNKPEERRGFLVFLNDAPDAQTSHIRISAIQSSGKAAYADTVNMNHEDQGYYD
jgi:hypothetical protein